MQVDAIAGARPAEDRTARRHRFKLTAAELLQLGLFRVGYVTEVASPERGVDIVVHGANGMAIAAVDSIEHAVDIADHLGLALVPVH
jgi:hypothetical protein